MTTVALAAPRGRLGFVAAVAAAPLALGLAHLLPETGLGLGIRLAAAAVMVLLLPGALIQRALGWSSSLGVTAAASFAVSLAVVAVGVAIAFLANANLSVVLIVIAIASVAALWPAARAASVEVERAEWISALGVLAAGAVFAGIVWWAAGTISGDAFFHLARARKLEEFDSLASLDVLNEFRDGGLHPGYVFPLWHAVLALIARLAGVDTAEVIRFLPAVLTPLVFLIAYGAGRALFRSWAGGVALVAALASLVGLARAGTGSFEFLTLPPTTARVLLTVTFLAITFALLRASDWRLYPALAAAGLAIAVVHPTYALFVALLLFGFLLARFLLVRDDRATPLRIGAALPALLVPLGIYTLAILPVLDSTIARGSGDRARSMTHYAGAIDVSGEGFRMAPEAIARGGAPVVAALLVIPLAVFAGRRLWTALVLGGGVAILAVLLTPAVFTWVSDAISLSQSRRLAAFLPLIFALAGAAVLLGKLRWLGVGVALAGGIGLQIAYPGEFTYAVGEGGPGWSVWLALAGGIAALVVAAVFARRGPDPSVWAAVAAIAFAIPVGVGGLSDLRTDDEPDGFALTPELVGYLRGLDQGQVIYSNLETSYRVAAFTPHYVAASPPAHVANTEDNRPYDRRRDVIRVFFRDEFPDADRATIIRRSGADFVVVDKTRNYPRSLFAGLEPAYEDDRYAVYPAAPLTS